ncbi:indole-3-glycerol phosphate synthase TrpC [Flavobacteriaceae bacterium]|nr:indole-3-glycerol phosphate synthase TrpC [Flavobacteriaceae bacterium]
MNILEKICQDKKELVETNKKALPIEKLLFYLEKVNFQKRDFISAIESKIQQEQNAIIAEVKKASPSKGIICEHFFPVEMAKNYEKHGASCISVLTDEKYFMGCNEFLINIRKNTSLPLLRKDFIIDKYQIWESKMIGADCILLIMAALSLEEAQQLEEEAIKAGLDVLVEAHNEAELKQALKLKSKLIGINNRNLQDLSVNIGNAHSMQNLVPKDRILICESGINSVNDFELMNDKGFKSFLIGEFLSKDAENINKINKFFSK